MFLIFFLVAGFATSEATFCSSPEDDTLYIYPNAGNCSHFIACIDSEEYDFESIQAPLFLPWTDEPVYLEPCSDETSTKKTNMRSYNDNVFPPDADLYPNNTSTSVVCPPSGESKAVVQHSCSHYLSCHDGKGTKLECPENQEFSPTTYDCVSKEKSDCQVQKQKGAHHIKCRYDKGGDSIYFSSETCPEFQTCANQMAWKIKCARDCHWNDEDKTCDWADSFDCESTNQ